MPYYTLKSQVPLGPGQTLAFRKGRGYYAKGGSGIPAGGDSLYATALRLAQEQEKPVLDALEAQRKQIAGDNAQRAKNAAGFSTALAELLKGIGPATEQTYQNAAGATGAFAKGFSDATQHLAENENASLTDVLKTAGLSDDQIAHATSQIGDTSDVLYGLGGYIPASGLEREGAAFTAAAQQLPAMAGGLGIQTQAILGKQASDQDAEFAQQLSSERGKIPAAARQILNDMISQANAQRSLDIQEAYLGNTQRATTASVTGIDPVTGMTKPGYHVDQKSGRVVKDATPGTSSKAAAKRESAFAQAQQSIFDDAQGLAKPMSLDDQIAWVAAHPGKKLAEAPKTHAPAYAAASKQLFDKYKYLLKFASRSGQAALKRRLNAIIRDALAAQGIHPTAPAKKKPKKPKTLIYGPTRDQLTD